MNIRGLFEVYQKEREYQRCCFGEYSDLESLNFASFLLFIEEYLSKAKKGYCGKWDAELPSWLFNSNEMKEGSAPVRAYEELVKVFVLAGAALETFADISPTEWRKDLEEESNKWKK
jgi:hypothetical protein